jgi:hypothetical protein
VVDKCKVDDEDGGCRYLRAFGDLQLSANM